MNIHQDYLNNTFRHNYFFGVCAAIMLTSIGTAAPAAEANQLPNRWHELKEYPDIDHRELIRSASLVAGKKMYQTSCIGCHGADGITSPMPDARAFGVASMTYASDPASLFVTLSKGIGVMPAHDWIKPEDRYHIIHYIRETYQKSSEKRLCAS